MAEIQNPNQQGGADNRSFLVMLVVMFAVLGGVQWWHAKHTTPLATNTAQQTQSNLPQGGGSSSAAPVASATDVPQAIASAETTTNIDSELYHVEFTNHGGVVKHWILKRYKDQDGKPLDLVNEGVAREMGAPFSLVTYDTALTNQLNQAMYVASTTGNLQAPQTLSFHYSANGLDVTKSFSFDNSYVLKTNFVVKRNGAPVRALLSWPSGFGDQREMLDYNGSLIESMSDGKADHVAFNKVSGGNTLNGPLDYAGVGDKFFAALFMPITPQSATAITLHGTLDLNKLTHKKEDANTKPVKVSIIGAGMGDVNGEASMRAYVGPRSYMILKNIKTASGENLSQTVDFGFFGPVAKALFLALHALQSNGISNWGWAIVVFTIIINLILLPLRISSMKSAVKMQRLQPQMNAIRAKYAKYKVTDPKRNEMNAELMKVQKDNGVNMFGGCIPSLVQLPLLWAMFTMLSRVVELREAHWFWLHDLTAADPYHILPIFMVVTQFLVQFYMPSPGMDPQQQKMMAFMMPAFSGYMTWNYASGLALYWCTGNVVMIIQQYFMNKSSLGVEMREIAAKRARKQNNKVIQGKR